MEIHLQNLISKVGEDKDFSTKITASKFFDPSQLNDSKVKDNMLQENLTYCEKKKNFFSQWKGEKNFQQSKKPNNLALNEIRVHWREEFSNLAVVELESKCKRPLLKATQISGKNMVDVTLEREKKKLHYNLTQITLNSHWKTNS